MFGFCLQCLKRPEPIGVGYAAQYVIKPLLGFVISKVLVFCTGVLCFEDS